MNNIYYYHTKANENGRRATFAGVLDSNSNTLKIGLAVCSRKDQFQKRIGRAISTNRANSKPSTMIPLIQSDIRPGIAFRKVVDFIVENNKNELIKLISK